MVIYGELGLLNKTTLVLILSDLMVELQLQTYGC